MKSKIIFSIMYFFLNDKGFDKVGSTKNPLLRLCAKGLYIIATVNIKVIAIDIFSKQIYSRNTPKKYVTFKALLE